MPTPDLASRDGEKPLRRARYLLGDPDQTRNPVHGALALLTLVALIATPVTLLVTLLLLTATEILRIRRTVCFWVTGLGVIAILLAGGPVTVVRDYAAPFIELGRVVASLPNWLSVGSAGILTTVEAVLADWWPHWFSAQLPIALVVGSLVAWWTSVMRWLHTDEWMIKPYRKGIIAHLRQYQTTRKIRSGDLIATRDGAVLGVNNASGDAVVLRDEERVGHVFDVGANGSGKTTTARKVFAADCKRGRPSFYTDLKGDPEDRDAVVDITSTYQRPIVAFSLDGGSWWDPFRYGTPDERRNMLTAGHDWTGSPSYYKDAAVLFAQVIVAVLDATPGQPYESTLEQLLMLSNMTTLGQRAGQIPPSHPDRSVIHSRIARLAKYISEDRDVLNGYLAKLEILVNTEAGRWMRLPFADGTKTEIRHGITFIGGYPVMDLTAVRTADAVALFSFSKPRDGELTARLGRLAIQNQIAVFGQMAEAGDRRRTGVYIDEFSALESSVTNELLARGRAAGADVLLATQTIEDLEIAADERAAVGQLLSNVNTILAHRIGDADAAERIARTAGTRQWVKHRMASTVSQGMLAVRRGGTTGDDLVDEDNEHPVVRPRTIQDLGRGEFVLIARSATHGKRIVQQARTVISDRPQDRGLEIITPSEPPLIDGTHAGGRAGAYLDDLTAELVSSAPGPAPGVGPNEKTGQATNPHDVADVDQGPPAVPLPVQLPVNGRDGAGWSGDDRAAPSVSSLQHGRAGSASGPAPDDAARSHARPVSVAQEAVAGEAVAGEAVDPTAGFGAMDAAARRPAQSEKKRR